MGTTSTWSPLSTHYIYNHVDTDNVVMDEGGSVEVEAVKQGPQPILALAAVPLCLLLSLLVIVWYKKQMSDKNQGESSEEWICHPVIRPTTTTHLPGGGCSLVSYSGGESSDGSCQGGKEQIGAVKGKPKGLLERRGSSASLTIDLIQTSQGVSVTPTRECTTEEFLLSVGNVLNRQQLRVCLKDVRSIHREFCELPLNIPDKVTVPGSWAKNRYMSVIPNEATRVRLPSDDPSNDNLASYINANYIRGYDGEDKAFIGTQGPLAHTVTDFWNMVWSEKSPVIVMITKLWEKSKSKCEPYFPMELNASATYGPFIVTTTSVNNKDGYIVRTLDLQFGEEKRKVMHFWFDSWQDHKTPPNTHSLLSLTKEVEISRYGGHQRRASAARLSSPSPIKDTVSPVLTLGTLELKSPETLSPGARSAGQRSPLSIDQRSPLLLGGRSPLSLEQRSPINLDQKSPLLDPGSAGGKKRLRQLDEHDREFKFFKSPLPWDGVFRFENESDSPVRRTRMSSESSDSPADYQSGPDSAATTDTAHSVFWKFEKLSTGGSGSYDTALSPSWGSAKMSQTDSPNTTESDRSPFRTNSSFDSPAFTSSSSSGSSNKRWMKTQSSGESVGGNSLDVVSSATPLSPRTPRPSQTAAAGPVVVHCSAGIGRTGCFIAISIGVNQLLWENNVDILGIVCRMRYDRGGMVQTAEQYEFIHRALALFERSLPDQSGE